MASQFGWAPLASLLVPDLRTGAAAARPLLWAPCNVRSDGTIRRSSVGARVLSLSFVGLLCSSVMADNAADTARLFSATGGNLPEILDVQKWRPPPGETGRGAVNNGSAGDLRIYRLNKTGSSRPYQGRQRRLAWLHARAFVPPGAGKNSSLVTAGGSG